MKSKFEKEMDSKMKEVVKTHMQLRELVLNNTPSDELDERLALEDKYFKLAVKGVIKEMGDK